MRHADSILCRAARPGHRTLKLLAALVVFPLFLRAQSGNGMGNAVSAGNFEACGMRNYYDSRSNSSGYGNNYDSSYYPHPDGQPSPDVWYTFTVSDNADMQISTCGGTGFDTYLHLLDASGYLITGNDDGPCGTASTITYSGLGAGTYYVVVEGKGYATGTYGLNIGKLNSSCPPPPLGDKMSNPFVFDTFDLCGGSVSDSRWSNNGTFTDDYGQPSADIYYRITLPATMDITVSTCGSGIDTYVTILDSSGGYVSHNDDNYYSSPCPGSQAYLQITLPAGTYYIVSEGYGYNTGLIVTTVTAGGVLPPSPGANMSNAIDAGTFSGAGSFSDSRSNADACLGDDYGQKSNDIFYRFTLTDALPVRISHCGSGFDTYMYLLNSTGGLVASNDDSYDSPCPGSQAFLQALLPAGTYYVVSEGYSFNTGTIVTGIEVLPKGCAPLSAGASSDRNYVITYAPRAPFTGTDDLRWAQVCEVQKTVRYYDGLGRPQQTVQERAAPGGAKDIVQPFYYDGYGREARKYLPYAGTSGTSNSSYRVNGLGEVVYYYMYQPAGMSAAFNTPYAQTVFDDTPIGRALEQGAPGSSWQPASSGMSGAGHTVKTVYDTNTAGEVYHWNSAPGVHIVGIGSFFGVGELFKTVTKDENWASGKAGTLEEFKDKLGRTVLRRRWETEVKCQSTYYVYDNWDNLLYVLPPEVTETGPSAHEFYYETDPLFLQYIYAYHYDYRNRVIEKKIPGKGWEYVIYNRMDQIVATQDAEQRKNGQWLVYKYDAMGRVVMTGFAAASRTAAQSGVDGQGRQWEDRTATGTGYTANCWPGALDEVLTVNYYDGYNFPGNTFGGPSGGQSVHVTGLLTGSKVRVLGSSAMLLSVNYYDTKGRLVESRADNHLGGTDVTDHTYNFTGQLTGSTRVHTAGGQTTTIATTYNYDHAGRKLQTTESINGAVPTVISSLAYSDTGQLIGKTVGDGLNTATYTYNERGWLKGIASPVFGEELKYNDGTVPQYNGNIANQIYTNGGSPNTFNYSYDKLNRLVRGEISPAVMSEVLTYDDMGNITSLDRDNGGAKAYSYSGNRLLSVAGVTSTTYQYDDNGNATTDGRNGMALVYNYLNLPVSATKTGTALSYTYDATGRKLRKTLNGQTRDYVDGIEYSGNTIDIIHTEEGVARSNGGTYSYEYNQTDHLGNVRATFYRNPNSNTLDILQRDDYYAFGKRKSVPNGIGGISLANKYLYNGKEVQDELGGQYDYGARFYDPVIGRWNVVDPLAESYYGINPYGFVNNSPIVSVDEDGRFIGTLIGAAVGAIVGGVSAAIHHENVWKGAGKGAIAGAVAGAVVDITVATAGTGTVALVAAGGLSGAAGSVTGQLLDHGSVSFKETAISTGLGLGFGYLGAKLSPVISGWLGRSGTVIVEEPKITQFGNRVITLAAETTTTTTAQQVPIQFGKDANQVYHTFRHIQEAGLSQSAVQSAVEADVSGVANSLSTGKLYTGTVNVNGVNVTYNAFKLPNGTVNIGRITTPKN